MLITVKEVVENERTIDVDILLKNLEEESKGRTTVHVDSQLLKDAKNIIEELIKQNNTSDEKLKEEIERLKVENDWLQKKNVGFGALYSKYEELQEEYVKLKKQRNCDCKRSWDDALCELFEFL